MIELKQIKKRYGGQIPKKAKDNINSWIKDKKCQVYIKKALAYKLSNSDYENLYLIGNQKAQYPHLYYLCCIYIHPLSVVQGLCEKIQKLPFRK